VGSETKNMSQVRTRRGRHKHKRGYRFRRGLPRRTKQQIARLRALNEYRRMREYLPGIFESSVRLRISPHLGTRFEGSGYVLEVVLSQQVRTPREVYYWPIGEATLITPDGGRVPVDLALLQLLSACGFNFTGMGDLVIDSPELSAHEGRIEVVDE